MVGTAESFLKYNTVGTMKNLLALEDHLRNLSPRYESEDASCLMKHSLQLEEQADEGISHASELEDGEKVSVFHDLQEGARHLREQFKSRVSPSSLIVEVRRLRKRAEVLDPSFNLEKCKSCGNAEDFLGELREMEGRNGKGLYPRGVENSSSEHNMVKESTKDVALVIGGVNLGFGIGYAAKTYLDPLYPGAVMGYNPSLLIDIGGTALGVVGALKLKKEMYKKLAGYVAAGLSTHLWEDIANLMPVAPAARLSAPSAAYANATGYPTVGIGAVGTNIPGIPGTPYPVQRLAGYPFAAPVSIGPTMSPPHYTLNGNSGLKNVVLGPKYTLDT